MLSHLSLHEIPDQETKKQHHAKCLDALRLFQEKVINNKGIFEKAEITLDPILGLIGLQQLFGSLGVRSLAGAVGQEDKAAGLGAFLDDDLGPIDNFSVNPPATFSNNPRAFFGRPARGIFDLFLDSGRKAVARHG